MKIYSQDEVVEKIKEFNEYLAQEQALQEELLTIDISGSRDKVHKNAERHDEIIAEIEKIRNEKMMPIIEDLSKFVSYCERVEKGEIKLGDPIPETGEEVIVRKKQQ